MDEPSADRLRVGAELRRLREVAGLSGDYVARTLGWSQSKVSRIETGRHAIVARDVAALLIFYGAPDDVRAELLAATARDNGEGAWIQRAGDFVRRQVVHDHRLSWIQGWCQHLLDVGEEGGAGHRPIEHHRRGHAGQAQRADERRGFPMTVRHGRPAPLSARRPAAQACHLCRGAALVDEDQVLGVEIRLRIEPGLPSPGHIRALLLAGMRGFF